MSAHINHPHFNIRRIKCIIFLLKFITPSNMDHLPNNIGSILNFSLSLSHFPLHQICHYPGHSTSIVQFTSFFTLLFSQLTASVHIHSMSYCPIKIRSYQTRLPPSSALSMPITLSVQDNSSRSVVFICCWLFGFGFSSVTKIFWKIIHIPSYVLS